MSHQHLNDELCVVPGRLPDVLLGPAIELLRVGSLLLRG